MIRLAAAGSNGLRNNAIRRSWPGGSIDLLLQAGLSPEAQARRAWAKWIDWDNFEQLSQPEARLIGAFSQRLDKFDLSPPVRQRIGKLSTLLWARTQQTLIQTADAIDQLLGAEIPFLVFKGGAFLAERVSPAFCRVIGDVDVLVRGDTIVEAIDALSNAGWSAVNGESAPYLRRLAHVRISGNYRKGQYGEVDLHINPFHFAKADARLDDALWRDAVSAELAGRRVLVPDPADSIVITLAHAPISDSAEWAIDVASRIAHQSIDWNKVTRIADKRGLVPSCLSGLRYLHDILGVPVPESAFAALSASPVTFGAWLKYWSNVSDRRDRNLVEKTANRCADGLLGRQGYARFIKDHAEIGLTRKTLPLHWLTPPSKELPLPASTAETRHEFIVAPGLSGHRLVLEISIRRPPVSRRIYFEATANGEAIARLRCRLGPAKRAEKAMTFSLPIPQSHTGDMRISIESRPTKFLPPNASQDTRDEFGEVPFRLLRAYLN
jgi:hypothetical protein